jgi:phosphoenolpyruvate carboxykinase (diphosphate)
LIRSGMLERINDFVHNGLHIPASRLGYRITEKFVRAYLARVFDNPGKVFTKEILKPELQDPDSFADGILHITEAQQRVAQRYMEDGSYELACPPLQALLSIMATGDYEGKTVNDDALIASDWYRRRLRHKKQRDIEHWRAFEQRLSSHMNERYHLVNEDELGIAERLAYAKSMRARAESPGYEDEIVGTLGADPMQPSLLSKSMVQRLAQV